MSTIKINNLIFKAGKIFEIIQQGMANEDMRTCSTSSGASRKYKPNPLERLKCKARSTVSGEGVEAITVSHTVDRCVKWCNHFGREFGRQFLIKIHLSYDSAALSGIQNNSPILLTTQMYTTRWMEKQIALHQNDEISLKRRRNCYDIKQCGWISKHCIGRKKPDTKNVCYHFFQVTFLF